MLPGVMWSLHRIMRFHSEKVAAHQFVRASASVPPVQSPTAISTTKSRIAIPLATSRVITAIESATCFRVAINNSASVNRFRCREAVAAERFNSCRVIGPNPSVAKSPSRIHREPQCLICSLGG